MDNQAQPIIVPRSIRSVMCSVIETSSDDEPHPQMPQRRRSDREEASTAINFLLNIESENVVKSPLTRSVSSKSNSYQHCLEIKAKPPIFFDLEDFPGRIEPGPIKESLNSEFQEKFQFLQKELTLSKLVNLREDLFELCHDPYVEVTSVAVAWVYFLRLVNQNVVDNHNRKVYAAVCLLLASKFNEEALLHSNHKLKYLLKKLFGFESKWNLHLRDILKSEFEVYALLNFSIKLKKKEVVNAFTQVLRRLNVSPQDYLGDSYATDCCNI